MLFVSSVIMGRGQESVVMWFEDFPLGKKIVLGSYTFTEENILAFAQKYDPQPFHVDKAAAEQSIYGGLIASGWHTAAVWMKLMIASRRAAVAAGAEPCRRILFRRACAR